MELQEIKRSEDNIDEDSFLIKDESVMKTALDVFTEVASHKRIILMAKGDLIPNAVAVANIVTENMLKGNSSIQDIKLDSVISEEDGQMISNIKITLIKN
jgi:archaea-specific DNA-binding protein